MDLRLDPTETEDAYRFEYVFERDEGETKEVEFVTDTLDRAVLDQLAREEFADELGSDVEQVDDEWAIHGVGISFYDPPWNHSPSRLTETIRGFDSVASARFVPVDVSDYGPAEIRATAAPGYDAAAVIDRVRQYHSALETDIDGDTAVIYPRAIAKRWLS